MHILSGAQDKEGLKTKRIHNQAQVKEDTQPIHHTHMLRGAQGKGGTQGIHHD